MKSNPSSSSSKKQKKQLEREMKAKDEQIKKLEDNLHYQEEGWRKVHAKLSQALDL